VFPDGCTAYQGPNPFVCYTVMWIQAKCLATGAEYPGNLNAEQLYELESLNLEYCILCLLRSHYFVIFSRIS